MQKHTLGTIFLIVFIDLLGFSLILPLLPFIAEKYQANEFQIGLLTAVYSFFQFIGSPILGELSDRYGRKKLLIVSQIGTFLGFILLGFANSLPLLFLSRLIDGITGGNISIAQAYIADITNQKNRARGMGVLGAAFGLGFIIGPVIGGILSQYGFAVPAFFAAAVSLISILATTFLLQETVNPKKTVAKIASRVKYNFFQFMLFSRKTPVFPIIITFLLLNLAFAAIQGNLSLWTIANLNYGPKENSYAFAYIGVLSVITQLKVLPYLLKRFSEQRLLTFGLVILATGMFLIPLSFHLSIMLLSLACIALGNGLINPTIQAIASENVAPDQYGKSLGFLQSGGSIGRILGPIIGGELFFVLGSAAPFIFSGLLVFGVLLVDLWKKFRQKILR